jgi:hypothetical protein
MYSSVSSVSRDVYSVSSFHSSTAALGSSAFSPSAKSVKGRHKASTVKITYHFFIFSSSF